MPGAYLRSTPYPILYKRSQDRVLSASASCGLHLVQLVKLGAVLPHAGVVQHPVRAVQEIGT
jgi:hypothetical protein